MKTLLGKLIFATVITTVPVTVSAQWAVIDAGNIKQTTVTATNAVKQTAKQLEQYKRQLQQLEDQIRNSVAPAKHLWDEANKTVRKIQRTANTLKELKRQAGSIDDYLKSSYGSVDDYLKKKCYTSVKCTRAEWDEINYRMSNVSVAQKRATEALLMALEESGDLLEKDADQLVEIQESAETAEGRLAAMGYANQLASAQVNQLIQLRSALMAQQTAFGMRQKAIEDLEAQQRAVAQELRKGDFEKSSGKAW